MPPTPPKTCGTCRHGRPDGFGMTECLLGWEVHDDLWRHFRSGGKWTWERVTMGHGGLPLPLLAPQTSCMVPGGNWEAQT